VSTTVVGQLIFAGFMVLANWGILAILTAVVSDNMIMSSHRAQEEDLAHQKAREHWLRVNRLKALFLQIDVDKSGTISSEEWQDVMNDTGMVRELYDATQMTEEDLSDLFKCLAVDVSMRRKSGISISHGRHAEGDSTVMFYESFIEVLRDSQNPSTKRCVLQLMAKIRKLEKNIEVRINEVLTSVMDTEISMAYAAEEALAQNSIVSRAMPDCRESIPARTSPPLTATTTAPSLFSPRSFADSTRSLPRKETGSYRPP